VAGRPLSLSLLLCAAAIAPTAAANDAPDDAAARKRKVAEAKRLEAEAEKMLVERVNAAIDRGATWLEGRQDADGVWPSPSEPNGRWGVQALCLLTLLKCGREADAPSVKKGLAAWRKLYEDSAKGGTLRTYDAGITLMMLDALYGQTGEEKRDTRYAPSRKKQKCRYPKDMEEIARNLVDFLVTRRNRENDGWRYPDGASDGPVDMSCTQYAMLGLWAASRCGFDAPPECYHGAVAYALRTQAKEGKEVVRWIENPAHEPGVEDRYGPFLPGPKDRARGWAYLPNLTAWTGSMTTAGIAVLAIAKDRLKDMKALTPAREKEIDAAMRDGVAWLGESFKVDGNPGTATQAGWHYYYLYGLERVGGVTGLRHVGRHDWYRRGAEYLVDRQHGDGGWVSDAPERTKIHESPEIDSCFALLFLKRATVPPVQGPVLTGAD
jgi:hypothetical protein